MSGCHDSEKKINDPRCIACDGFLPCNCFWQPLRELKQDFEKHNKWAERYVAEFEDKLKYTDGLVQSLAANFTVKIDEMLGVNFDSVWNYYHKMEDRIEKLERSNACRKPHKCPVCNGSQRDYFDVLFPVSEYPQGIKLDHEGRRYQDCGACEGKGIVWG